MRLNFVAALVAACAIASGAHAQDEPELVSGHQKLIMSPVEDFRSFCQSNGAIFVSDGADDSGDYQCLSIDPKTSFGVKLKISTMTLKGTQRVGMISVKAIHPKRQGKRVYEATSQSGWWASEVACDPGAANTKCRELTKRVPGSAISVKSTITFLFQTGGNVVAAGITMLEPTK